MAPKNQTIVHNGAPSKGKTNTNAGGTVPPHATDRERATVDGDSFLSQGTSTSARPLLYECQILQMLLDMKNR